MGSLELHRDAPDLVVLAKRVPLELLVDQDAPHVWVVLELDPKHVPHLALGPVRAEPNPAQRSRLLAFLDIDDDIARHDRVVAELDPTTVTPADEVALEITGDLTIRTITNPVTFSVTG